MPIFPRSTYLDHNATTPVLPEVRQAMDRCLRKTNGNASSLHTAGRQAHGIIDAARESVAGLLGCPPMQVIFTSGGTEGNNAVIKGVFLAAHSTDSTGSRQASSGQAGKGHVITSRIEHESVLGACQQVESWGGKVTYLSAAPDGRVRTQDVRAALRPETVLISTMHANNETGAVQPVEEIGRIARDAKVPFHTDAVQSYGKIPTRVDNLGCEFLTLTAHKINGPKGIGALYWRGNTKWTPLNFGGDQERKMRAGTEGIHQIAGIGKAAELAAARMTAEHARLRGLRKQLTEGLSRVYPSVKINEADAEHQMPGTVSATFPGKSGLHILAGLDCYEVAVSIGSACTADRIEPSHVLLGMGRSEEAALSTVRISMGTTTKAADVRYFLAALKDVIENEPAGFAWLDPKHLTEEMIRSGKNLLIDLRYPYERMMDPTIPGATLGSYIGFDRSIRSIPRDKTVILMCGTGIMSFSAGYRLARSGHPAVRVVYGGYAAWRALHPGLIERLKGSG
jgi:cysteine desulfurase